MKRFIHVFLLMFCAMPGLALAQVATTAGSNLTAWNGNMGATNNNEWNQMMNPRGGGGAGANAPAADFGNCNALILRCAQPKCSGCTTMDVARPIVAGCVNSNATCKKHGDALIDYITAQMVSTANSRAQEAQMQAQAAAAQAAAAESNAQMQQMQMQMQQMQAQMAEQNQQQMQQMQAALEQQKAMTDAALAEAAAAAQQQVAPVATSTSSGGTVGDGSVGGGLTAAQQQAAAAGVEADILVREQISGQILTKIEDAEIALKKLNAQMQETFRYAGCDVFGNNCAGPKRVKKFKEMALEYFRPYDEVVDNAYEALEMALAVGVDVSDVIMMLSGACNRWGKFLCNMPQTKNKENAPYPRYDSTNCRGEKSVKGALARASAGGKTFETTLRGGFECSPGMVVPPQDDVQCTLVSFVGGEGEGDEVLREWLLEGEEGDGMTRVGCATSALDTLPMFGRRSSRRDSSSTLDLDTLERILVQDAPEVVGQNRFMRSNSETPETSRLKYCAMTPRGYETLRGVLSSKKLPKKICVPYDTLARSYETQGSISIDYNGASGLMASGVMPADVNKYTCDNFLTSGKNGVPPVCNARWVGTETVGSCQYNATNCVLEYGSDGIKALRELSLDEKRERGCRASESGGTWNASAKKCDCPSGKKVRENTSYQCVSAEAITDADCKAFAKEMGADDANARVNGDGTCVAKNYQLINYGYCDVRKCNGDGVRKRKISEGGSYNYNVCCWCSKGAGYAFNPDSGSCTDSGGGIVSSAAFMNAIGSNPFNLPLLNNGTASNAGGLSNLKLGVKTSFGDF
ncbi:MAG: hypothetical protein R8M37_04515 [Alphaproteobacteria bacterium]|nr:hypothetical protein [Alphaproteobacteria bacterium]